MEPQPLTTQSNRDQPAQCTLLEPKRLVRAHRQTKWPIIQWSYWLKYINKNMVKSTICSVNYSPAKRGSHTRTSNKAKFGFTCKYMNADVLKNKVSRGDNSSIRKYPLISQQYKNYPQIIKLFPVFHISGYKFWLFSCVEERCVLIYRGTRVSDRI